MLIPTKKLKNGFEIPVYGLGTWMMGGKIEHNLSNDDKRDIDAIKIAIENGVTHIDTSESYASGYAEILIRKATENYDRKKLFIASKAYVEHLSYDDLIYAASESIKRLNCSFLDLYYAHRYSLTIPIKETMRAMNTLIEEGLINNIGVSNFNLEELEKAQSFTKHKIVANQLHFNLKTREAEKRGLLEYCQKNDIMLIAWRPLQKGMLLEETSSIVSELATKYHKTPAQIAISWIISHPNVVTITKTTSREHLLENLGAVNWQMEKEDIERLREGYPNQEDISDTVPLH